MELNWDKVNGLMPVIIQDARTLRVLMLGYMNEEALGQTQQSGLVTFYSRTQQKLWTKGETSGNSLHVQDIHLIVMATPCLLQPLMMAQHATLAESHASLNHQKIIHLSKN